MKTAFIMTNTHKSMRGFEYMIYSAFSLSLVVILMFLPLAPLFASEESGSEVQSEEQSEDNSQNEVGEIDTESDLEENVQFEDDSETFDADLLEENNDLNADTDSVVESESLEALDEQENTLETVISDETVSQELILNSEASTQSDDLVLDTANEVVDEVAEGDLFSEATSTDVDLNETLNVEDAEVMSQEDDVLIDENVDSPESEDEADEADEEVSSTTESVTDSNFVNEVTNDQNRFSFATDECTLVGDGTFYCAKPTGEAVVEHTDRVFSAIDADGDKEIYIEKNGELTQITFNQLDDESPYFDEISESLVWHRLIDGRYQIISFDIDKEKETQLTHDRYNNMQPTRFGDITVWQGWVGDDWEVFQLVGDELLMLTDNTVHDISPHMNGTHIIWQSFEQDAWVMKVYDIRTQAVETVEGGDGGSIENPRFVLVYDTKYESGDIETKGYDLESGEVLELAAKAAPIPEEIPSPEQTGEERALVSPLVQPKSKADINLDDDTSDDLDTDDDVVVQDVVIPSFSEIIVDADVPTTSVEVIDDAQFDLHVSEVSPDESVVSPSTTPEHIHDLIITPFVEEIGESDSQELVVTEA